MHDIEKYFSGLKVLVESRSKVNEEQWLQFRSLFRFVQYKKGSLILQPGDDASWFFYVGHGLVKRYIICHDGAHYITDFDAENRVVSDFASFIEGTPAKLFIEAVEDTAALVSVPGIGAKLRALHPTWEENGRRTAELRFIEKAQREYEFLHHSALQRLEEFRKNKSNIFGRVPQKDIAHYIGVTPESLNRLMKQLQLQ